MTQPATNFANLRPDLADSLEQFDLQANQMGMVGLRIAPVIEVDVSGGEYGKIELKELLKKRDTLRAEDGSYNRGTGRGTKDTFSTEEHGFEERVDRREATMFRRWWDAEALAAERSRDAVITSLNDRVTTLALTASNSAAASVVWSTTATATPVNDVRAAKIAMRNRCGMMPNAMVIDWEAYQFLRDCDQILDRIKYAGFTDPIKAAVNVSVVAQALDIDELIISGAVVNTANEANAASLSAQWDRTQALLFVRNTSNNLRAPRFMNTFHWGEDGSSIGAAMESYYNANIRSDVVRHRMDTDEKIVYDDVAQRITGVLA